MKDPKSITMKNGSSTTQGTYPPCGTKIFRRGKGEMKVWPEFIRKAGY